MEKKKFDSKIFRNLYWVTSNIYRIDRKYIVLSFISMIVGGIIPPISLIIMQNIINNIQTGVVSRNVFLLISVYVGVDLIQTIFNNVIGYYNSKFLMKFDLIFSEKIYRKASRLSLDDYENSETYDLINRAQYEGGGKLINYYNNFISISTKIITLFSYVVILFKFKIWIVLLVTIFPIIKYFINNMFNFKRFEVARLRTNDSRKSWYLTYLLTYGNFYKELKNFNLFDYFIEKYKIFIRRFNSQDLQISKKQSILFSLLSLFETISDGLLFSYTVVLGINKIILIGNVITYTRTIINSKSCFTSILNSISTAINESLFIEQLFEYFNIKEENNIGKIKIDKIESIKIVNLSYKYKNSNEYALKNISLEINKSRKIAIIGMNGSGKTTLIKLIMGFYTDYEGSILINGIELRQIDKESLHSDISALFQDFVKYEATFRENIAYGNLEIMNDDEKINLISEKFNLVEIIEKYEKKLDTQLGAWFDNGVNLSMGQWQKVALSRIFAKNSGIYILDEPNAAMDSITEYEISSLYEEILKDRIGIIITHKFNNIISVIDDIYVMQKGEIIEQGSHKELLNMDGVYKRLYDLRG